MTRGLYKSNDQGRSFKQVSSHDGIITRPFYYTNIDVDPKNPEVVYAMSTGNFISRDGGENWERLATPHGDNHDMWINPDNPDLYIQANDGGANVTHNGGKTWSTQFNQPTAELYQVEVDDQYPYWLYAGMQDNGTTISVPSIAPLVCSIPTGGSWTPVAARPGLLCPSPGTTTSFMQTAKGALVCSINALARRKVTMWAPPICMAKTRKIYVIDFNAFRLSMSLPMTLM